jgi:hypothetical protein
MKLPMVRTDRMVLKKRVEAISCSAEARLLHAGTEFSE